MTLIGDTQRVAGLMYLSVCRDTNTKLGKLVGKHVFEHLLDRELVFQPVGWTIHEYRTTQRGRDELERLLGGHNEEKSEHQAVAGKNNDTPGPRATTDPA